MLYEVTYKEVEKSFGYENINKSDGIVAINKKMLENTQSKR